MGADSLSGGLKVRVSPIAKNPRTNRAYSRRLMRYQFENLFWKDFQAMLAGVGSGGPGYVHLPADLPEEWYGQFTAEHKVIDRKRYKRGRSGRPVRTWQLRHSGAANHYWDCEILNCVLTDEQLCNLRGIRNPAEPPARPPKRLIGNLPLRSRGSGRI